VDGDELASLGWHRTGYYMPLILAGCMHNLTGLYTGPMMQYPLDLGLPNKILTLYISLPCNNMGYRGSEVPQLYLLFGRVTWQSC
jgi:hypothetical protein